MSGSERSVFDQRGQHVAGNQANIGTMTGDLTIGGQTKPDDIAKQVATLKAEIAGLQGLEPEVRRQVDAALDSVVGVTPSPERNTTKKQLDDAGNALSGAAARLGAASVFGQKALDLAKTIFDIGKWVIGAFGL